jgi:hypothetical protein
MTGGSRSGEESPDAEIEHRSGLLPGSQQELPNRLPVGGDTTPGITAPGLIINDADREEAEREDL